MRPDLSQYDVSQATHKLKCRHCICRNTPYYYKMPCLILNETKSGKLRIVVFGDRYWGRFENKRIRYVPKWRVVKPWGNKEKQ